MALVAFDGVHSAIMITVDLCGDVMVLGLVFWGLLACIRLILTEGGKVIDAIKAKFCGVK